MDALKAELLRKKSQKEAEKLRKAEGGDAAAGAAGAVGAAPPTSTEAHAAELPVPQPALSTSAEPAHAAPAAPVSEAYIVARFRQSRQPIRLFGETDEQRIARFEALEARLVERQDLGGPPASLSASLAAGAGAGAGVKRKRPEEADNSSVASRGSSVDRSSSSSSAAAAGGGGGAGATATAPPKPAAAAPAPPAPAERKEEKERSFTHEAAREFRATSRSDPRAGDKYVYKAFRGTLYEWEGQLASMSEEERAGLPARQAARLLAETEDNLKPMLRALKHGELPVDIKAGLMDVVDGVLDGDYKVAGDAYIKLAVGNAQWLIGVSQVGLHERAAREKVYLGKIAHVMNDETQRKYIISIKRLLTWLQEKYKDSLDPSRMLLTK